MKLSKNFIFLFFLTFVALFLFHSPTFAKDSNLNGYKNLPTRNFNNKVPTEEVISDYNVAIKINKDASLTVTEKIKVYAKNINIRHGIYRDYPTKYSDDKGTKKSASFNVLEVKMDNFPIVYYISKITGGKRLYIGDSEKLILPGWHEFTIKYNTKGHVRYFEDHDEIYYDAIGDSWMFPIENAKVLVQLPDGVTEDMVKYKAYVGKFGESNDDYEAKSVTRDGYTYVLFKTNNSLGSYTGMTIVVSWPKGYVHEPTQNEKFMMFIMDNIWLFSSIFVLAFVLGYYFIVWWFKGRDPYANKVVIPEYELPKDVSPALAGFIHQMGFNDKQFTSAIIDMAIKGVLKINAVSKKEYVLEKVKEAPSNLYPEEQNLYDSMFSTETDFKISKTNYSSVQKVVKAFKKFLDKNYKSEYFTENIKYYIIPIIVTTLYVLFFAGSFIVVFIILISVGLSIQKLIDTKLNRIHSYVDKAKIIFGIIGVLLFILFLLFDRADSEFIVLYTGVLLVVIQILIGNALYARTKKGSEIEMHILGLIKFLTITEKDRYNAEISSKVPKNMSTYEKYLPYAVALDVEPIWTKKFRNVIDEFMKENMDNNKMLNYWIIGNGLNDLGSISNFNSAFANTITTSATYSSSSSSSGFGGGFVGGGSGGGGGGGW